jgi:hypothetical protein
MKNLRDSIIVCALLSVMMATVAQGATTLRYVGSGDYNDLVSVTGANGWPSGGSGPGGLPGTNDLIRLNYGNNVVTLTNVAPDVFRIQLGVDESGQLVIESGGKLNLMGNSGNQIGNNPSAAVVGRLTVKTNGELDSAWYLEVGASATGILTVDGGTVNLSHHLWVGSHATGVGAIILTNGGVFNMLGVNGNGMLGIGTINASSASGGQGAIYVSDGSVLNLFNIDGSGKSIWPGSVLDISGSGIVTIPGDRGAAMTNYVTAGKITAYGGTGTVAIDYDVSNPGKTTLKAIVGYVPPTEVAWNPAANPACTGLWSESANWTGGLKPAGVTKVNFNVVGATPCTVNDSQTASYLNMGENGPGGTLIVTNGGVLTCGSGNASVIGNNNAALMVVENGGTVTFGDGLSIGLNTGADGTLLMNDGTVSAAGVFNLGFQGGKGTVRVKGGTLNLSQWDESSSLQGDSVMDVSRTGKIVINGNHQSAIEYYVTTGQVTNSSGAAVVVDYNIINVGKTTIYPSDLNLPPAQATWNPGLNWGDTEGLWNVSTNWSVGMCPGNGTVVTFNVLDVIPCTITNAAVAGYIVMGNGSGPGGTLIVTNGGSLTTGSDNWSAVGYGNTATMIVENGSSASFGNHLWVGFDPTADGTLIVNGGSVSVGAMFGLGWNGGKGTAQINGGTLNLSQWHPTDSIKGQSVLNITGTGAVVITGNYVTSISNFVSSGKITANGGPNVAYSYNSGSNKTILQVAPPLQSVKSVAVSGGNATVSYETTAGHIYHIESTPTLSPAAWTPVAGSTTNATGSSVTFTFPAGSAQAFYRTVSP